MKTFKNKQEKYIIIVDKVELGCIIDGLYEQYVYWRNRAKTYENDPEMMSYIDEFIAMQNLRMYDELKELAG